MNLKTEEKLRLSWKWWRCKEKEKKKYEMLRGNWGAKERDVRWKNKRQSVRSGEEENAKQNWIPGKEEIMMEGYEIKKNKEG